MTETKHTAAPLEIGPTYVIEDRAWLHGGQRITEIRRPGTHPHGEATLAFVINDEGDEECSADIAVFIAAPAMLAALIQAVESAGFSIAGPTDTRAAEHGEPAWICNARAAIAQAATPVPEQETIVDVMAGAPKLEMVVNYKGGGVDYQRSFDHALWQEHTGREGLQSITIRVRE